MRFFFYICVFKFSFLLQEELIELQFIIIINISVH